MTDGRTRDDASEAPALLNALDDTLWEQLWRVVDNLEGQREQLAWRIRTLATPPGKPAHAGTPSTDNRPSGGRGAFPLCELMVLTG